MSPTTALLVIDVQTAMFDEADPVHNAEGLLATIQGLLEQARSTGTPIIYVQHNEKAGEPLEAGAPGWEIHPSIRPHSEDTTIQKWTPDSFHKTPLHDELSNRGITRLILTGLQTELCVDTTCRRARSLGYDVVLVEDAHSTWNSRTLSAEQIITHHNSHLVWFAKVVNSSKVTF